MTTKQMLAESDRIVRALEKLRALRVQTSNAGWMMSLDRVDMPACWLTLKGMPPMRWQLPGTRWQEHEWSEMRLRRRWSVPWGHLQWRQP